MRKAWLVVIPVILIAAFYLFTSVENSYQFARAIAANDQFALRELSDNHFVHESSSGNFQLLGPLVNEFNIAASDGFVIGRLIVIPIYPDSAKLILSTSATSNSFLPWKRWQIKTSKEERYKRLDEMIIKVQKGLEEKEKSIVQQIRLIIQPDSFFISKKISSDHYPSDSFLMAAAVDLETYAKNNGAKRTGPLIYNCAEEEKQFLTMIAIPIDRIIPDNTEYALKKMIPANVLTMETTGDSRKTREAFRNLGSYANDRSYKSPAMPFIQLLNPGEKIDSLRISRVFYPVY